MPRTSKCFPAPIGGPWMHAFQGTRIFQAHEPFLRFSFPSMTIGGPLMATGGIPWILSTGAFTHFRPDLRFIIISEAF